MANPPHKYPSTGLVLSAIVVAILCSCQIAEMKRSGLSPDQVRSNKEEHEKFYGQFYNLIKMLPPSARVVVPEFDVSGVSLNSQFAINHDLNRMNANKFRDFLEQHLTEKGVKVVDRAAFKHAEQEIVLSQTGVTDPETSIKVGKAVGATHLVLGNYEAVARKDVTKISCTVKFIDTERHELLGVAVIGRFLPLSE